MTSLSVPLAYWNANPNLPITSAICSEDSHSLAFALSNGYIWLADFDTSTSYAAPKLVPKVLLVGHKAPVSALTLARIEIEYVPVRENILLSASEDGYVVVILFQLVYIEYWIMDN